MTQKLWLCVLVFCGEKKCKSIFRFAVKDKKSAMNICTLEDIKNKVSLVFLNAFLYP